MLVLPCEVQLQIFWQCIRSEEWSVALIMTWLSAYWFTSGTIINVDSIRYWISKSVFWWHQADAIDKFFSPVQSFEGNISILGNVTTARKTLLLKVKDNSITDFPETWLVRNLAHYLFATTALVDWLSAAIDSFTLNLACFSLSLCQGLSFGTVMILPECLCQVVQLLFVGLSIVDRLPKSFHII